jgi:hypothetical protein
MDGVQALNYLQFCFFVLSFISPEFFLYGILVMLSLRPLLWPLGCASDVIFSFPLPIPCLSLSPSVSFFHLSSSLLLHLPIPPQTRPQSRILHAREEGIRAPRRPRRVSPVPGSSSRPGGGLVEPVLLLDTEPDRVVVVVVECVNGGCGPLIVLFVAGAAERVRLWGERGKKRERERRG